MGAAHKAPDSTSSGFGLGERDPATDLVAQAQEEFKLAACIRPSFSRVGDKENPQRFLPLPRPAVSSHGRFRKNGDDSFPLGYPHDAEAFLDAVTLGRFSSNDGADSGGKRWTSIAGESCSIANSQRYPAEENPSNGWSRPSPTRNRTSRTAYNHTGGRCS
jgi:hypothetical protein